MTLAPWRQTLARALHQNRANAEARYFQLATVTEEGKPANRTVVFRDFLTDTNQLQIVTDTRSEKMAQITVEPNAEACWYFTKTREQFRIAGTITIVDCNCQEPSHTAARHRVWQNLSDAARLQFVWPEPGRARTPQFDFDKIQPPSAERPVSNFALLLLAPYRVDHLELKGEPQNRTIYVLKTQGWSQQEVNP